MTHTVTHTRKNPDGVKGRKRAKDHVPPQQKRPESTGKRYIRGWQSVGKDEVPSSNLGSSSKEKPCNRFGNRVFLFVGEREPRQKTAFQLIGQLFGAAYPCLSIGTQGMAGSYLSNRDPIAEKKKTFGFIEQE